MSFKELPTEAKLLDHYITAAIQISRVAYKRRADEDEEGAKKAIKASSSYMMKARLLQEA